MAAKIYAWDAPEGYWYTQRSLDNEAARTFIKSLRSKKANAIDAWVLWTDEQKEAWEAVWLNEPEGE